ncbi:dockerin type I domain-containing protein [Chloroflexota bacterium]
MLETNFTAKIKIRRVENLDATNYDVTFDNTILSVDNVTTGLLNGTVIPVDNWNEYTSGNITTVQSVDNITRINGSGYLAVIHFKVLASAAGGVNSTISLTNGTLSNTEAQEILAEWVADSVKITAVLPGDTNGDEVVNALDIIETKKIIVRLAAATPGADANGDSNVNTLDITFIKRIIVRLE